ncbi:DMT family transporter [Aquibacillus koreensis]|uniref:DMT family transporter n=1 Tax=Aquibacillus koreensis TaxID=279446 RepID=A0A9X3WLG8_9BACI|nr:DMT family transporter [Aquibacillus koreensis]MCT2535159.1 DMT family transporter [Aquibacillus koreensis]MDC3421018.1 DMT family transporter [Aquibacillus koreensis]
MRGIFERKSSVILIAIFCSVLWGSAFPVLKISYEELQMDPDDVIAKIVFAGIRFLIAGVIVLGFLLVSRPKRILVTRRQFLVLIILGVVQTALQYFFFYNGLAKVSGVQGAILASSGTFFTVILAHYFYKNDRMNWKKTIGLIAGFTGIAIANWGQELQLSFQWDGEGYMILSGVTSAIATIMAKELATGIHPFAVTGWQLSLGAIILLLIGIPQIGEGAITFTPFGWGLLLYSALLSSIAFGLWYSLLKFNYAGEISIYKFIVPVSGTVLSSIFIPGEQLNLFIMLSIAMVASGIIVINYKNKQTQKRKDISTS